MSDQQKEKPKKTTKQSIERTIEKSSRLFHDSQKMIQESTNILERSKHWLNDHKEVAGG